MTSTQFHDGLCLARLRDEKITPEQFVGIVRRAMADGSYTRLLDMAGAKYGSGISASKALGNLIRVLRKPEQVETYQAAFYPAQTLP